MRYYTVNGKKITSLDELPDGLAEVRTTNVFSVDDLPRESSFQTGMTKRALLACVRGLLDEQMKIPAIKLVRHYTGWGLRETKEFVESLEQPMVYKCKTYTHAGGWKYVGERTVEQALEMFHNAVSSVLLKDTILSICEEKYEVSKNCHTLIYNTSRNRAIQVFREQF